MSKDSTPVDHALFEFVQQRTIQADELLRSLRLSASENGLPQIHIAPLRRACS
jgi:hypothetical protein